MIILNKPHTINSTQTPDKTIPVSNADTVAPSGFLRNQDEPYTPQYEVYQQWRNAVYEELMEADMEKDAKRWLSCETFNRVKWNTSNPQAELPKSTEYVMVCSNQPAKHPKIVQKHTCSLRYCPTCAERFSARFLNRYVDHILQLALKTNRYRLRHIVLTTPFSLEDADIEERYKQHQKNVAEVMDLVLSESWRGKKIDWRKDQGWLVADEFGEEGLKLHSHINHLGAYISYSRFEWAWKKVTGGECKVVWVKGIKPSKDAIEKELTETLKYCTKFWKEKEDGTKAMIEPRLIPKLAKVLKGQRRVRSYGLFYNIPEPEQHKKNCECEVCGFDMVKIWKSDWLAFANTGMTWDELVSSSERVISETDRTPRKIRDAKEVIQKQMLEKGKESSLLFKPANKSVLTRGRTREKPPSEQRQLTGFESISPNYD